ncbi:hypothetical protein EXN66_Car004256 [Channa argus]|uniref:Uncharacterized protein n=1 Tax=Channa argus TaxID=215402 RepID=A0A6G1PEN0_CHAAH|nr:hypothetical protein EXN66_Car004256 [Channa argus]
MPVDKRNLNPAVMAIQARKRRPKGKKDKTGHHRRAAEGLIDPARQREKEERDTETETLWIESPCIHFISQFSQRHQAYPARMSAHVNISTASKSSSSSSSSTSSSAFQQQCKTTALHMTHLSALVNNGTPDATQRHTDTHFDQLPIASFPCAKAERARFDGCWRLTTKNYTGRRTAALLTAATAHVTAAAMHVTVRPCYEQLNRSDVAFYFCVCRK